MKKSFPANINGTVYYIDEDAYTLLDRYLKELHHTFTGATGEEIVADIESRISEHFDANGTNVVVMADVEKVISVIGRPEQLGEEDSDEREIPIDSDPIPTPPAYEGTTGTASTKKHLFRDPKDAVFGGVFAGLGYYLGWNVTAMRVLYVALALISWFWPLTIVYLVAWMLIPAARTPRQILEMMGEPVNITTIGQTLVDGIKKVEIPQGVANLPSQAGGWINSFFRTLGRIAMAVIGGCAAVMVFILAIFLLVIIAGVCLKVFGNSWTLLESIELTRGNTVFDILLVITAIIAFMIPMIGLFYGGLMALFNAKAPARALSLIHI